ncbi:MAG: MBL fold metallo-hydrolase [Acidobacteriota bacterium]|nr:MBL fold metallo-hydrolase [Acidobacteriota bacterium]
MRIEFFGVRGSFPSADRCESRYGAATPCARIESAAGDAVILDAGTGLRMLGTRMAKKAPTEAPLRATILFTHFHLDHVFGLPFFDPLFLPRAEITFISWLDPEEMHEILGRLMKAPLFPVAFDETPCRKTFLRIGPEGATIGGMRVQRAQLRHPQGCMAYRFEDGKRSAVFATDTEHPEEGIDNRLAELARKASLFVYDAMYTPEEYAQGRKGWGHSTWEQGVELARAARVERLFLSHLNPEHDDRTIGRMRKAAKIRFRPTECAAAGLVVKL